LEAQFTYAYRNNLIKPENKKWLENNGYVKGDRVIFSDAFVAINSGTTRQGNSLKAPLEAIRKKGLVPNFMLPLLPDMSWEDYHSKSRITPEIEKLGYAFADRFNINYEEVKSIHFADANKDSMLVVAGYAWSTPKDGRYYRTEHEPNHAWMNIKPQYYAFDSYEEGRGDFIKELNADFKFYDFGYRVYVSAENTEAELNIQLGIIAQMLNAISKWLQSFVQKDRSVVLPQPEPVATLREKLHTEARGRLGTDVSPRDLVVDNLGCAESVSNLIKTQLPNFPLITGTWTLWDYFNKDRRFAKTLDPKPGTIIISPTATGNGMIRNGHVGIFTEGGVIMSSDSTSGYWMENYTIQKWVDRFRMQGGFPIYYYDLVG